MAYRLLSGGPANFSASLDASSERPPQLGLPGCPQEWPCLPLGHHLGVICSSLSIYILHKISSLSPQRGNKYAAMVHTSENCPGIRKNTEKTEDVIFQKLEVTQFEGASGSTDKETLSNGSSCVLIGIAFIKYQRCV